MTAQEFDIPSESNSAEMFSISARCNVGGGPALPVHAKPQASQLDALLKRHPELAAVRAYIEETKFFDMNPAKVYVVEKFHHVAFMQSRHIQLQGAFVVANFELLRRFDRTDLGLSEDGTSVDALDAHIPFVAKVTTSEKP